MFPVASRSSTLRRAVPTRGLLVAACLVTGIAWGVLIPPFEAPDEIYISKLAYDQAKGRPSPTYNPMFVRLASYVLAFIYDPGVSFESPRNPAFRFVSNKVGHVNMFMHGRVAKPRSVDVRRLYALRALAVVLSTVTILLIYGTARMVFPGAGLALMVAGLCLLIPQFSFMASKVHPELLSTLWGAAANFVLAARATKRLGRLASWALLIPLLVTAPMTDLAAIFLIGYVPIAMVLVEDRWRGRVGTAACVLGGVGASIAIVIGRYLPEVVLRAVEGLSQNSHVAKVLALRDPWSPFLAKPDTLPYFLFEFWPKMFMGFWGWLGQPSILLPAWMYAAFLALTGVTVVGLVCFTLRRQPQAALDQSSSLRRFVLVSVIGLCGLLVPIVYAAVLWNRDEWYGRWLFPMMGPIAILVVSGVREFADVARRRPHVVSGLVALGAGTLGLLWMGSPGQWIRAGIGANHYGDQPHLIRTLSAAVLMAALIPLIVEACVLVRTKVGAKALEKWQAANWPLTIFRTAWAFNLVLLVAFVRPLYAPLDEAGYLSAIREETRVRDFPRAAGLVQVGMEEYPASTEIARHYPGAMMRAERFAELRHHFHARVVRGDSLRDREELIALARTVRVFGWPDDAKELLVSAVRYASVRLNLPRETALVEVALNRNAIETDEDRSRFMSRLGAIGVGAPVGGGQISLEGFVVNPMADGRSEIVIYFRPLVDWTGRLLWLHAYPEGSNDYVDIASDPPAYTRWGGDDLAWEIFHTPQPGVYNLYVGVATGDELGPAHSLGVVGTASR